MNRICPSEEIISEYLSGTLAEEDTGRIEEHLTYCTECRAVISDAYKILDQKDIKEIVFSIYLYIKKHIWVSVSLAALAGSFIFRGYFIQFLAVSLITGIKWMVDTRTIKTLVMINEKYKQNNSHESIVKGERNGEKNTF